MSSYDFDLFVIGGGSGGVRCARIAAGHGAKVAIAEDTYWGGTCVNVGCVPKKVMVQAAEYGQLAADSHGFGWSGPAPTHDWAALIAHKDGEIGRLNGIYSKMLTGAGVTLFDAHAAFIDANTLQVGSKTVTAERIVIATGGYPTREESVEGFDLGIVSDEAFHLPALPRRILLVGGGYIGVEFAGIFAGLGAEVDVVYRADLPLRGFDEELRALLADGMTANGVRLHPGDAVIKVEAVGAARRVTLKSGKQIETDLVFFAIGRDPRTQGLGLEKAGVTLDKRGRIAVDGEYRTNHAHIYAIGDVSNRLNLTPVALAEGHHLADRLFGRGGAAGLVVRPGGDGGVQQSGARDRGPDRGGGGVAGCDRRLYQQLHADAPGHGAAPAQDVHEAYRRSAVAAGDRGAHAGRRRDRDDAGRGRRDHGGGRRKWISIARSVFIRPVARSS